MYENTDRDGNPNVFKLERNDDGLWLNNNWAEPTDEWNPDSAIIPSLYFASISHETLKAILAKHIDDTDVLWLLGQVINSFHTDGKPGVGLPLGNLTSQLLVNVYMNEFDQFIKRALKVRYYIRYADDFVCVNENRAYLQNLIPKIAEFLTARLKLSLNPSKVFIKTLASGVDFLGWVHFPYHRVLRTTTRRRIFKRLNENRTNETLASYLGLLSHGDTYKLERRIQYFDNGRMG